MKKGAPHTTLRYRPRRLQAAGAVAIIIICCEMLLACLAAPPLQAQGGRSLDNVLYPQPDPLPVLVGPEFGRGFWQNKASFSVSDRDVPCVNFTDGNGAGFTAGAKAFLYATRAIFFSPRVRYEARSGSFTTALAGEPARDAANNIVTLDQEGRVDATIAAVSFDVTLGVEFFRSGIYIFGGGSASLLLGGYYDYSESLKGPAGIFYDDTHRADHRVVSGHSFESYQSTAFDLRGGLGYIHRIGRFAVNPEVFYSLPLTNALGAPDTLQQTGVVATIGFLYYIVR